jgi:hypothetical protein
VYTFLFRFDPDGGIALAFEESQQSLRLKPESIGDAVECGEQGCDMDSLGNLRLAPAGLAEQIYVGFIDFVRVAVDLLHEPQKFLFFSRE